MTRGRCRTLVLLDLESHPPPAAIDRVAVIVDPTPGRIVQHTLYARAQPAPEQVSTLVARLGALMGQDRLGAAVSVDSHRPGAFAMQPFAAEWDDHRIPNPESRIREPRIPSGSGPAPLPPAGARARAIEDGRPLRVTTDRRGFAGGSVVASVGPWRTSGSGGQRKGRAQRAEGNGQERSRATSGT